MRRAGLIAFAVALGGCPSVEPYACVVDTQCRLGGEQGICAEDRCAYEDAECPSGFRYPEQTDLGLAGVCAPDEGETPEPEATAPWTPQPEAATPWSPETPAPASSGLPARSIPWPKPKARADDRPAGN